MTRPPNGMRVTAIATITVPTPAPSAMAMAIARIKSGKDCRNSMMRWLRMSLPAQKLKAGLRPVKRFGADSGGDRNRW
ncbi:MAG: hypothetical protein ACREET_04565 [Stellaceae bacterium]